jgi:hypothetical protein
MPRHAVPAAPDDFWARLAAAHAPKVDNRVSSYSEAKFRRIIAWCRAELRQAATRIRSRRAELAAWRAGAIDESDRIACERGFYSTTSTGTATSLAVTPANRREAWPGTAARSA